MVGFTLTYTWVDNNGGLAEHKAYIGPGITYAGAVARATALADVMQAISSAALLKIDVRADFPIVLSSLPALGSSVKRRAILFYRNGPDCASLTVPSPPILLAEASGLYAGFRITRERLGLLALLSQVEALPSGLVDPVGRPYGTTFSVGGIINV